MHCQLDQWIKIHQAGTPRTDDIGKLAKVVVAEEEGVSCSAIPEEAMKVGPCPNKTSFKQWLRKTPQQPEKLQQPSFLRLLTELDLKPRMATTERLLESPLSYVGFA